MPQHTQNEILSSLRNKYPNLSTYSDEDLLSAYNDIYNLTPSGLPSAAKAVAEETPPYTPQHTGAGERFGKRFAEAFTPFAWYEPEMDEAEGFGEHLAGALGGGFGFLAGAFPIAAITGGASIPLRAARGISLVSRIASKARAAEKLGKTARSQAGKRSFEATEKLLAGWMQKGKFQPEAVSLLTKGKGGILGKSEAYRKGLESIAKRGTSGVKLAKAMDMGVQNFATFATYGQLHMKPGSQLQERWNQLKADTATAGLFTALGAGGTRVAFSNVTGGAKGAVITGEMFAMGLAGAYMTDLGQTDIPWEERLAHSVTLMLLHGFGLGMDRAERREGVVEWLGLHGFSREQAKEIVYNPTFDGIEGKTISYMKKDPKLFVDKEFLRAAEEIRIGRTPEIAKEMGDVLVYRTGEVPKPASGKPYVQYDMFKSQREKGRDDIAIEGEPRTKRIYGETIEEAQKNFNKRFMRYKEAHKDEFPDERLKKPEGVTAEDSRVEKEIKSEQQKLRRVNPEPGRPKIIRDYEIEDIPTKGEGVYNPAARLIDKLYDSLEPIEDAVIKELSAPPEKTTLPSYEVSVKAKDRVPPFIPSGGRRGLRNTLTNTIKNVIDRKIGKRIWNNLNKEEMDLLNTYIEGKVKAFRIDKQVGRDTPYSIADFLRMKESELGETAKKIRPKVDTYITNEQKLTKDIANLEKTIENKQYVVDNGEKMWFTAGFLRGVPPTQWHKYTKKSLLQKSIDDAATNSRVPRPGGEYYDELARTIESVDRPKLKQLKQELSEMNDWEKAQAGEIIGAEYGTGDFTRIPLYEGKGKYSGRQASLGKYIGKYGNLDKKSQKLVDTKGLEQTSAFDNADVFHTFTPTGPEKLEYVAIRPRGEVPEMKTEFLPETIEKNAKVELDDATKAVTSTGLPGVSQEYREKANYRFSMPADLKEASDLPGKALVHPDIVDIVSKLEKEGMSPKDFIKELKKKGDDGVKVGDDVYFYAGEMDFKPKFDNIKIIRKGEVDPEAPPPVRDPKTKMLVEQLKEVFALAFPAEDLPVEYNKANRALWRDKRRTVSEPAADVPAKMTWKQRLSMWNSIGIWRQGRKTRKVELEGDRIKEYSEEQLYRRKLSAQLGHKPDEGTHFVDPLGPTFGTRQEAEGYLSAIRAKKYQSHVEFYKKEKTTPEKEGIKIENKQRKQAIFDKTMEKGGALEWAREKQAKYQEGKIVESASFENLEATAPYNTKVLEKITDNFKLDVGKSKQLNLKYKRLSDIERERVTGEKPKNWTPFKNGNLLDANFNLGFNTEAEAHAWAIKYWMGEDGGKAIDSAINFRSDVIQSRYKGTPEYKRHVDIRRKAIGTMSKYGAPYKSERMKNIIDTFFPEALGDFEKLNTRELDRLNEMFRTDDNYLPSQVDMGAPPDNITPTGNNPSWLKFINWASAIFPSSVIQDATGSGGRYLTNVQITAGRSNRIGRTDGQIFGMSMFKHLTVDEFKALHIERDSKFEGARAGEHLKTIERLKNKKVRADIDTYDIYGETIGKEKKDISLFQYGNYIIDRVTDTFAYRQGISYSKTIDPKTGKYLPFIEIIGDDGKVIAPDTIVKSDLLDVMRGEIEKGKNVRVYSESPTAPVVEKKIGSIEYNHYEPNFFPRDITQEFFEFIQTDKGNNYALDKIIEKSDEIRQIEDRTYDQRIRRAVAAEYLVNLKGFSRDNKVNAKIPSGQVFARVADLDPWIYYDSVGARIEPANTKAGLPKVYNQDGLPFKVGDTMQTIDNRSLKVGKAIQVYSTDSENVMNRYVTRTSRSIASYEAFGGPEGLAENLPERGINIPTAIERMKSDVIDAGLSKDDARWFEDLSMRIMKDQMYGRDYEYPYLGKKFGPTWWSAVGSATRTSATVGLSMPLSGIKNLGLGQTQLGVLSGRELLRTYYHLLTNPEYRKTAFSMADAVGVRGMNTYDLFIKPAKPLKALFTKPTGLKDAGKMGIGLTREALIKAGMMRPTEMFNRVIAVTMAPRILAVHLDNMLGRKYFSNIGISKSHSIRVLEDIMRFEPRDIDKMLTIRKSGGEGWTEKQLLWATDRAHSSTQGVGEHPYIPYIMGRDGFKPLTLFYRIAYRMTDHIANTVIKPAIYDGNIWPMMKYVGLSMAAGEGMYALYWYAFGEERKNNFKDAPASYWSNFIRAEGLGIFSNAFDEYGNSISDSYTPVVFRNFLDITEEAMNVMQGKKKGDEAINSAMKRTIALYSGAQRVYNNLTKATKKRVQDSKRRQSQFLDAYFPDYTSIIDASDALTRNSPFYESIRNIFWLDTPKEKAHEYYVALNYLTHVIQRQNVALAKNEPQARKMAKSRIKGIISRMRPIPSTWRDRKKGDKTTKYKLYVSKLKPEQIREELELEKLYRNKKREFWSAVAQYR